MNRNLLFTLIILTICITSGCQNKAINSKISLNNSSVTTHISNNNNSNVIVVNLNETNPPEQEDEQMDATEIEKLLKEDTISRWISDMTLEQKVAQLFFLDFKVTGEQVHNFDQIEEFISQYSVGGFIYFSENILNQEQVINLNLDLQNFYVQNNLPPVFIGVDEEGGLVSRLTDKALSVTPLPTAANMTNYDLEDVYNFALTLGQEMSALGFNINFAPVLDINNNPKNKVIGERAYSNDAILVADYASSFSKGLENNVLSFGKHFPGHGNTTGDSHFTSVTSLITKEEFYAVEGLPFQYAIKEGISGIMLGHIRVPNLVDNVNIASLNSDIVDLLRHELSFDGLIITDSLQMLSVTNFYDSKSVAIEAYQAGIDLILMPEDFIKSYSNLLDKFYDKEFSISLLDEKLNRILSYKYDFKYPPALETLVD